MKYLVLSNLSELRKSSKTLLIYCLLLIGYCFIHKFVFNTIVIEDFYMLLGLDLANYQFINILFYIAKIAIIFYIVLLIFIKDFQKNQETLFLRIRNIKWFLLQMISIFIFIVGFKLVLYFILSFFFKFTVNVMVITMVDIWLCYFQGILLLCLYCFSKVNKLIAIFLSIFLFVLIFLFKIPICANELSSFLPHIIVCCFIVTLGLYFIIRKNIYILFERS